ncbi:EF-hand calcium-binding domain-containing protein 10 isoform X1 [Arvicola amphibius]|uniref:EF-hand calcium-binding domain-containing protein 10 isoform X1 n=1 Tax=Arvicola amphibius TaxID=1047088 RepID=UPI0018E2982F|nr:EF-hand calcium-binding domain-containing protein 10 isoform X1 [Arvicola amphibius]
MEGLTLVPQAHVPWLTARHTYASAPRKTLEGHCSRAGRCAREKPREYLISLLERLRIAKVTGIAYPFFMENSNIVSMFEMMDSHGRGCISFVQYKEALKNLGLCTADEVLNDDGHLITLEKFRDEVNRRTQEIWSSF